MRTGLGSFRGQEWNEAFVGAPDGVSEDSGMRWFETAYMAARARLETWGDLRLPQHLRRTPAAVPAVPRFAGPRVSARDEE